MCIHFKKVQLKKKRNSTCIIDGPTFYYPITTMTYQMNLSTTYNHRQCVIADHHQAPQPQPQPGHTTATITNLDISVTKTIIINQQCCNRFSPIKKKRLTGCILSINKVNLEIRGFKN
uniref:Uncharacterized protein n=1 Tax=Opuntia streptacantha TaxID=393608 RepID=A0A7C9E2W4_OPUST